MATRDYWAEAPMNRPQTVLFGPTLDSTISEDDPVRLFDEVLVGLDWSGWEAHYDGTRGQRRVLCRNCFNPLNRLPRICSQRVDNPMRVP